MLLIFSLIKRWAINYLFNSYNFGIATEATLMKLIFPPFFFLQDILWVLDTGIVNNLVQPIKRCPPKVIAIDTSNGKIVKNIDLTNLVMSGSRLQYLVADYDQQGGAVV